MEAREASRFAVDVVDDVGFGTGFGTGFGSAYDSGYVQIGCYLVPPWLISRDMPASHP